MTAIAISSAAPSVPGPVLAASLWWRRRLFAPGGSARSRLYHEIASLTGAGIGVREALDRLERQHGGRSRRLLEPLVRAVHAGAPLAPAMEARPDLFPPLETALVATGERSGRLDRAFAAASAHAETSHRRSRRLVLSVVYPVFLLHFGVIVMPIGIIGLQRGLGAYLAFVVPVLTSFWLACLLVTTLHAALHPRPSYAAFLRAVPILGRTLRAAALGRFCRALAALHGSGIGLDQALATAAAASGDAALRADLAPRAAIVSSGRLLAEALTGVRGVPSELVSLIATGEHGGDLEAALDKAASSYEERCDVYAKAIPPALFVLGVALIGVGVLIFALDMVSKILASYRGL